jgi:hypothetical protein
MKFDFPIDTIEFDFWSIGRGSIQIKVNGRSVSGNTIHGHLLKKVNVITISFFKIDPTDTNSFARLQKFKVNDGDFTDMFSSLDYKVDKTMHPDADDVIQNNLYFGYVGEMDFVIEQTIDLLPRAAWVIANETFNNVKWPTRNNNHREKNFENIYDDYRFMFTGCHPPRMEEIDEIIDKSTLGPLIAPLRKKQDKLKLERWINSSRRVEIQNLSSMQHFTFSNGTTDSLFSFMMRHDEIYMPKKMYHHNRQILDDKNCTVVDLDENEIKEGATVLIELPSPWYSNEHLISIIKKAKEKNCYVGVDFSWLPTTMDKIELDATNVDEIFFSMNKCWPIHSLRPAVRWSKARINDSQTFDTEVSIYPKVGINLLYKLIDKFDFDHTYDKYIDDHTNVCDRFGLIKTPVMWFATHKDVTHDSDIMEPYFYLDDFVCVVKLLQYTNKFFW